MRAYLVIGSNDDIIWVPSAHLIFMWIYLLSFSFFLFLLLSFVCAVAFLSGLPLLLSFAFVSIFYFSVVTYLISHDCCVRAHRHWPRWLHDPYRNRLRYLYNRWIWTKRKSVIHLRWVFTLCYLQCWQFLYTFIRVCV